MKHPVDAHVGKRIRHRRWMVGMTQQQLADRVGIKFQQIQKYETGMNRVSASRLWDVADALGVNVGFDSFAELQSAMIAEVPALGVEGLADYGKLPKAGKGSRSGGGNQGATEDGHGYLLGMNGAAPRGTKPDEVQNISLSGPSTMDGNTMSRASMAT